MEVEIILVSKTSKELLSVLKRMEYILNSSRANHSEAQKDVLFSYFFMFLNVNQYIPSVCAIIEKNDEVQKVRSLLM